MWRVLALLLGLALLRGAPARAVGDGNDLLPDMPLGPSTVRLRLLVDVGSDPILDIASAGDASGRLFLVSPRGVIRIFQDGALLPGFFLNAPASPAGSAMSSLAFHPLYASNRKLYVITGQAVPNGSTPHYTPSQDDTASAFDNLVVEYLVQAGDPNAVDTSTRRELLRIHKPQDAHNVNDLAFAPTGIGHLVIAVGDGGLTLTGTPSHYESNAQPTTNPYGKFLRIDVDAIGPNGRYAIPPDNPYASGADGNVPEIYAWGVRNPWRITRDRATGALYSGVNGNATIEQIYRAELGRNHGWALKEGSFLWNAITGEATVDPSPDPELTPPLAEYDHNGTTQAFGSVIGGYVYRGARMPDLYGRYLFVDWVAGELAAVDVTTGALELVAIDAGGATLFVMNDVTFGEDEVGELYLGGLDGRLKKLGPVVLCGDVDLDDDLGPDDSGRVRAGLLGDPLTTAELARCSVIGSAESCDLLDAVVIRRAEVGLQPGVEPVCGDAN